MIKLITHQYAFSANILTITEINSVKETKPESSVPSSQWMQNK